MVEKLQQEKAAPEDVPSKKLQPLMPPDAGRDDTKKQWLPALATLLITAFIFISSQIIVVLMVGVWVLLAGADIESVEATLGDSNLAVMLLSVVAGVVQFALILWIVRLQGLGARAIGFLRPAFKDIGSGLLLWAGYFVVSAIALVFLQTYDVGIDLDQQQQLGLSPASSLIGLVVIYVAIVITPAFIEELLMRGYLFYGLRAKLSFWPTTLIVSILFGALHLGFWSGEPLLWIAFIDTFLLSLFLCWGTERYKTIWPAVVAHGIKNSIAFLVLFVFA